MHTTDVIPITCAGCPRVTRDLVADTTGHAFCVHCWSFRAKYREAAFAKEYSKEGGATR